MYVNHRVRKNKSFALRIQYSAMTTAGQVQLLLKRGNVLYYMHAFVDNMSLLYYVKIYACDIILLSPSQCYYSCYYNIIIVHLLHILFSDLYIFVCKKKQQPKNNFNQSMFSHIVLYRVY